MYSLEIKDHIMVAHSLPAAFFGPAQGKHGATFIVSATFRAADLTRHNVVVDIGRAAEALKAVLTPLNYADLDTLPALAGKLTTTEFLCRHIFDALAAAARDGRLGEGGDALAAIGVTLEESHVARASFEGPVAMGAGAAALPPAA